MPSPVDKYFKEVKLDNPSYSDEQAWATAWSIFCKHVNPESNHCKKSPEEYLKGQEKQSRLERIVTRFQMGAQGDNWEELFAEVPELVNTMSMVVGELQVNSTQKEWGAIKKLGEEALGDLQNAETAEKEADLWSNLRSARTKAFKLKASLQVVRSEEDPAVKEAVSEATQVLRPLIHDLEILIPG